LTYTNHPEEKYKFLDKCSVKIANYPEDIIINDTTFSGDVLTNNINYASSNS
jgi:hypothetical protein